MKYDVIQYNKLSCDSYHFYNRVLASETVLRKSTAPSTRSYRELSVVEVYRVSLVVATSFCYMVLLLRTRGRKYSSEPLHIIVMARKPRWYHCRRGDRRFVCSRWRASVPYLPLHTLWNSDAAFARRTRQWYRRLARSMQRPPLCKFRILSISACQRIESWQNDRQVAMSERACGAKQVRWPPALTGNNHIPENTVVCL